jgi:hypothetical protein
VELGGELVDLIEDDLKLSFPNEAKDAKVRCCDLALSRAIPTPGHPRRGT